MSATDWEDCLRVDGVEIARVALTASEEWIIVAPGRLAPITTCPCCDKPLRSQLAARRVADLVFPLLADPPKG